MKNQQSLKGASHLPEKYGYSSKRKGRNPPKISARRGMGGL